MSPACSAPTTEGFSTPMPPRLMPLHPAGRLPFPMPDGFHSAGYSATEAANLRAAFEEVRARLPVLYRSFWYRGEIPPGEAGTFRVHGEDGMPVLQIERTNAGHYRSVGLSRGIRRVYAARCSTIGAAIRAAGL